MPFTLAASQGLSAAEITVFLLSIAVLLGLARALGELARHFRQPAVLGEIFAGVILGKTVLGRFFPEEMAWLFPPDGPTQIALTGFTTLAVTLLLLVAGLEVDLSTVWRQGKAAISVSLTGLIFPFAIGAGLAYLAPTALGRDPHAAELPFALFFGIAMAITALPVIAKILIDLNMFKTDVGMLVMSAAMVDDIIGWMGFAAVLALLTGGEAHAATGTLSMHETMIGTLLFAAAMLTAGRWAIHRALPFVQAHTAWPGGVLGMTLTLTLACAAFTEWLGVHAIFGAFLAGVAVGDSSHLRERTKDTIHQFVTNIFAPVFFATVALRIDFLSHFDLPLVLIVLVIAIAVKVGACSLGARIAGLSGRESLAIGFGMSARGAMEIVLAQIALTAGLINMRLFVAIVIMALVTSLMSGPLMERLLQRRRPPRLADILGDKQYLPKLRGATASDAVRELAERAAQLTRRDPAEVHAMVMDRESLMGTALPGGLAVPHARLDVPETTVVLGRSESGVDFNSPDGQPARLIFLVISPAEDATAQVETLGIIARAMSTAEAREGAARATSYTQLLAALNATTPAAH